MKSPRLPTQRFISNLRHAIRPIRQTPYSTPHKLFHSSPLLRLFSRHPQRIPVKHLIRRFASNIPPTNLNSPTSLTLSQRMRKLSREYGWSALGIYLLLSALDFPFCFLAVRWLGTDRIGYWEHLALEWFWRVVPYPFPARGEDKSSGSGVGSAQTTEVGILGYDHGVKEAEQLNQSENASRFHLLLFNDRGT